jgi:hydrogenase maturation factor
MSSKVGVMTTTNAFHVALVTGDTTVHQTNVDPEDAFLAAAAVGYADIAKQMVLVTEVNTGRQEMFNPDDCKDWFA